MISLLRHSLYICSPGVNTSVSLMRWLIALTLLPIHAWDSITTVKIMNMENDKNFSECTNNKKRTTHAAGASSGIYGLAFIGALIYFIQQSTTFWMGVLGFLKALVWPAVLIYKVMEFLKM